jgi:hypothetical protein
MARIRMMGSRSVRNAMNVKGRLAGRTDHKEDLIDPSQEGGPSGRPGRGGVGWLQEAVVAEPSGLGGDGAERSQRMSRETIE